MGVNIFGAASNTTAYKTDIVPHAPGNFVIGETGTKVTAPIFGSNATIIMQRHNIDVAGSIEMTTWRNDPDLVDPEEIAIAAMSTEELVAEVRALAGIWADRPDIEEAISLSRKDNRLRDIYAPYEPTDPETPS